MRVLILGGRWVLRMADGPAPARPAAPRSALSTTPAARDRPGTGRPVADADRVTHRTARRLARGQRTEHRALRAYAWPRLRRARRAPRRLAAGRHRALRRAARRALFDEVVEEQAIYGFEQRLRHPRRTGGGRRVRARHPPRPPRHHGRLRATGRQAAQSPRATSGSKSKPTMAGSSAKSCIRSRRGRSTI